MKDFDPATSFDTDIAAHYVDYKHGDEEDAATFLAEFAKEGSTLDKVKTEWGILCMAHNIANVTVQ